MVQFVIMIKKVKKFIQSKRLEYFLLFVILALAFLVRLYKISSPVADWHSWRQADTASVSWEYVKNGIDLLHPTYQDVSKVQTGVNNPKGYRFVEFPIFNAIHAAAYNAYPKINFDTWGRLLVVTISVTTILAIFYLGNWLMGRPGGLMAAAFYAFDPYNIYFTRVILPDPISTTLAVFALASFVLYLEKEKPLYVYLSAVLFSLSLLIKPNSFFYAIPVVFLAWRKYGISGILKNRHLMFSLDIALIPIFLWRWWIWKFPEGIPHLAWAFNGDGIRFRPSFWRWIFAERIGTLMLGVWGVVPFAVGAMITAKDKYKGYFDQLLLLGVFLYVSGIATANVRHDYYQIYLVPVVALVWAKGTLHILQNSQYNKLLRVAFILFAFGMMLNVSADKIKGNYAINHPEIIEAGEAAQRLLPLDAKVVAPYNGDTAFMYQTKRQGWPIILYDIEDLIRQGADYYISVNKGDQDTTNLKARFKTVEEGDRYIILDLHEEL